MAYKNKSLFSCSWLGSCRLGQVGLQASGRFVPCRFTLRLRLKGQWLWGTNSSQSGSQEHKRASQLQAHWTQLPTSMTTTHLPLAKPNSRGWAHKSGVWSVILIQGRSKEWGVMTQSVRRGMGLSHKCWGQMVPCVGWLVSLPCPPAVRQNSYWT